MVVFVEAPGDGAEADERGGHDGEGQGREPDGDVVEFHGAEDRGEHPADHDADGNAESERGMIAPGGCPDGDQDEKPGDADCPCHTPGTVAELERRA